MYNTIIIVGKPLNITFFAPSQNIENEHGFAKFTIRCAHKDKANWVSDFINIRLVGPKACNTLKKAIDEKTKVIIEGSLQSSKYNDKVYWEITSFKITQILEYKPNTELPVTDITPPPDDDIPF